ncbi:prepilin-type N-terminal cleavage/methylation domain-containing protein [Idiomarina abyssalis]|uniref:Prepilin-type N-terminal cleavage/methylation domain-containing protein n=1 Tax=Idiomarina abyssalis TaxID=86102 RepID=A0A8I1G6F1_9GAMM|nr:prepilin-type N-terminal cleavage/methylation domain-containing protein [Idiomarina abyssalis]MBJ7265593.1 prepilin-type N-terminal cleavage/methylation domain-containing protein [Idiomarina abyssalis]MBJ7316733.1 prepilin-type N-terminal cleavage/methylation domain-containing protein [Idiomarina abyssalis]
MTRRRNEKGFTIVELMVVVGVLGVMAASAVPAYIEHKKSQQVEDTKSDIELIQQAVYGYYRDNHTFPPNMQALASLGYYTGTQTSPYGTQYAVNVDPGGQFTRIQFDTPAGVNTQRIAKNFAQSSFTQSNVSVATGRPTREAVANTFIHRDEKPGCPECNQMETTLDMNGNDLENVRELNAETVQAVNVDTENLTTEIMTVNERLNIGAGSLVATTDGFDISASSVNFSGDMSINGDIESANGDLTNFNRIEATDIQATSVSSDELYAQTGQIDSFTSTDATITNLTGDSLDYATGDFTDLTTVSLTADSATISTLQGDSLNYNTGNFNSFTTENLTATSGSVSSLSGSSLNYTTGTFGSLSTNSLNAGSGYIGAVAGASMNYTTGDIDELSSVSGTFSTIQGDSGNFGNIDVSGTTSTSNLNVSDTLTSQTGDFVTVDANNLVASNASFDSYSADTVTFGQLTVDGTLSANTANVSGKTTTSTLTADNSSLGTASAASMNVSGKASASSFDVSGNGDFNSLSFGSASGGSIDVNSFRSGSAQFSSGLNVGGNLNTSNAYSSKSSINQNWSLIQSYISQWNACKAADGCK